MGDAQAVTGAEAPEFERYVQDGRARWRHLPTGRTGWVISGGSDTMDPTGGEPAAPEAPPAPPEPAAAPSAEPDDLASMDHDRLVELARKLKHENVSKKQRYAPLEQAFDGADPQDVQGYLSFVQLLRSGDPANVEKAAAWMRGHLDELSPAQQAAVQQAADDASQAAGGDDEFDPFNPEAIAKLIDERATSIVEQREQARRDAEQRQAIIGEMNAYAAELGDRLGIEGLDDPTSRDFELLFVAAQKLDPNLPWKDRLTAAAEDMQGWLGEKAKRYMQAKTAEADGPAAPPEGGEPTGSTPPKTMSDARASAEERLKKLGMPAGSR